MVLVPKNKKAFGKFLSAQDGGPHALAALPVPYLPERVLRLRGNNLEYIEKEIAAAVGSPAKIYTSRIDAFDDKLELRAPLLQASTDEIMSYMRSIWEVDPYFLPPDSKIHRLSGSLGVDPILNHFRIKNETGYILHHLRKFAQEDYDDLRGRCRIACFVLDLPDTRHWENYAASHRGLALEFQRQLPLIPSFLNVPLDHPKTNYGYSLLYSYLRHCAFGDVIYSKELRGIRDVDIMRAMTVTEIPYLKETVELGIDREFLQNLVFQKRIDFAHEREWRLWNKTKEEYLDFIPYKLSSITLARDCESAFIRAITDLARQYDVPLFQMIATSDGLMTRMPLTQE